MRAYFHWRWRLDKVNVKINGQMRYLWTSSGPQTTRSKSWHPYLQVEDQP